MRKVRWKSKYLTGAPGVDERNKKLVAILNDLDNAMRAREHCQDMEELYGALVEVAEQRLSSVQVAPSGADSDDALRNLIRSSLPLEALDTPACRDCDICDLTDEEVTAWLDEGKDDAGRPDETEAA